MGRQECWVDCFSPRRVIGPIRLRRLWGRSENVEAKIRLCSKRSHFVSSSIFQHLNWIAWLILLMHIVTLLRRQGLWTRVQAIGSTLAHQSAQRPKVVLLSNVWHEILSYLTKCQKEVQGQMYIPRTLYVKWRVTLRGNVLSFKSKSSKL